MAALKTSRLVLTVVLLLPVVRTETLIIPKGTGITIDGRMGDGEWSDGLQVEFIGGAILKIKQDGQYLYLYIKGETPGVASLGIHARGSTEILHASAGLITAKYVQEGERWRQIEPFRSEKQDAVNRQANHPASMAKNLEVYGWCATILPRAIPPDFDTSLATEYKISLDLLENGASSLSVAFFQRTARRPLAYAPAGLADDSLNTSMVKGTNHEYLDFRPDTWMRLAW